MVLVFRGGGEALKIGEENPNVAITLESWGWWVLELAPPLEVRGRRRVNHPLKLGVVLVMDLAWKIFGNHLVFSLSSLPVVVWFLGGRCLAIVSCSSSLSVVVDVLLYFLLMITTVLNENCGAPYFLTSSPLLFFIVRKRELRHLSFIRFGAVGAGFIHVVVVFVRMVVVFLVVFYCLTFRYHPNCISSQTGPICQQRWSVTDLWPWSFCARMRG